MAKSKSIKRTNKNAKFSKLSRVLNFSTSKGKFLVFMLTFAVVGGGYATYQAFAATYPPSSYTDVWATTSSKSSDGVNTSMVCLGTKVQTGYGPVYYCVQDDIPGGVSVAIENGKYRFGNFNTISQTFYPETGWLIGKKRSTTRIEYLKQVAACKNMDNYFAGLGKFETGYGPTSYGLIYRYGSGKWQVRVANLNHINGNCYPSGDWRNATPD